MNWPALRDHLMSAAAAAALLGGGASIVTSRVDNAVQDERIAKLEELNDNVEGLRSDIAGLKVDLAKLEGREDVPRQ